nr:polyketide synthase [Clostridia bacterium]
MKEKVAIVGIGCVFPDAPDFTEYWKNIVEGKDSVHDISGEFWNAEAFYDPDPKAPDKTYSVMGAPVAPIEFDSMEFGLSPNVMQSTSTEQLFSLIAARQAMIDAKMYGKDAKPFNREKTGVIISSPTGKNAFELSHRSEAPKIRMILVNNGIPEDVADRVVEKYKKTLGDWTEDNNPGYIPNVVAGRIANRFDLGGTSCSVDAACASSLASIKFAVDELQNGNCDIMLAGGASLDSSVTAYISFCKTPAISKKGKITPFDAEADGMLLGDGVGIVVMKRLSDAKRDGDKIYAVIRGVGTSGDGRAKSIYAPSKDGQIRALRRAYENAEVEAESIGLIEAHGTGTTAGDACEVSAISEVFNKEDNSRDTIIGSVKSQIGHLRMSAGAAGLIKTALALHEKTLPSSINMTTPNPVLADSNLCVLSKPKAWIVNDSRPVRRAGVSSFGFGGTNYHIVMEEADTDYDGAYRITPSPIGVMFTGKDTNELAASIKALADGMETDARMWYKDEYRYRKAEQGSVRLAFTAKSADEVKEKCAKSIELLAKNTVDSWVQSDIAYSAKEARDSAGVTVLFSGQGTQELDMLSEMAMGYPEMRRALTDADNVMLRENGTPVSKLVYPNCLTEDEKSAARSTLMQTANTQPVLAAMEAGLYNAAV